MAFPRIRGGDPVVARTCARVVALFPAYAGVILELEARQWPKEPFPRIRGGDPASIRPYGDIPVFSPHTRG